MRIVLPSNYGVFINRNQSYAINHDDGSMAHLGYEHRTIFDTSAVVIYNFRLENKLG